MTEIRPFVTQVDEVQNNVASINNNADDDDSTVVTNGSDIPNREILRYTMYVVFDLETTGFCRQRHHIIEMACQLLDPLGEPYGDAFESLVNPFCKLTPFIQNLTGITNRDLYGKPSFAEAANDFFKYIKTTVRQYEEETSTVRDPIHYLNKKCEVPQQHATIIMNS